jgi:hypothetical protein
MFLKIFFLFFRMFYKTPTKKPLKLGNFYPQKVPKNREWRKSRIRWYHWLHATLRCGRLSRVILSPPHFAIFTFADFALHILFQLKKFFRISLSAFRFLVVQKVGGECLRRLGHRQCTLEKVFYTDIFVSLLPAPFSPSRSFWPAVGGLSLLSLSIVSQAAVILLPYLAI